MCSGRRKVLFLFFKIRYSIRSKTKTLGRRKASFFNLTFVNFRPYYLRFYKWMWLILWGQISQRCKHIGCRKGTFLFYQYLLKIGKRMYRTHNLSHGPWTWVWAPVSPKTRWKAGPLDGRKYNEKIKAAKLDKAH